MTLISDSIEGVKASILVAIKDELTETYPNEFGDYKTDRGDTYSKVFWADTIRYQPKFPYCMLSIGSDRSEGYDEITYTRDANGNLAKKIISRSFLTVNISIFDMGNEKSGRSSLEADTFALKVARQLRKYFNGDEKLDWFSGNEYYPRQISITVNDNIESDYDWSDTETMFRFSFDIIAGYDDISIVTPDLAKGAEIRVYKDSVKIDEEVIKIGKTS